MTAVRAILGGMVGLVVDTARLWLRFLPQLIALGLTGWLLNTWLLYAAARLGAINDLAGIVSLSGVVLVKLIIVVAMFETLKPGLPALTAAASRPALERARFREEAAHFTTLLSAALVPFFVYYTAWGLLAGIVREYSLLRLQFAEFGELVRPLEVSGGWWVVGSVAFIWLIRRGAKMLRQRYPAPWWNFLIVLCDASWVFIAAYVIAVWKGGLISWIANRRVGEMAVDVWLWLRNPFSSAQAAAPIPSDHLPPPALDALGQLFLFALLPVVWLTIAALIYRYDVHRMESAEITGGSRTAERVMARYNALPKVLRDFGHHFIKGAISRYRAIASSIRLTFASGLVMLLTLIVLYRAIDWAVAWVWMGVLRTIGPHEIEFWHVLISQFAIWLGSIGFPGDGGVIPQTLKVCLLAAALERAFAAGRGWRSLD